MAGKKKATKKKHAGGRPTKYTPEFIKNAAKYVDGAWKDVDIIPQLSGLAVYCGVSKTSVQEWKDRPEFSALHARIITMQEQELINQGLSRKTDSSLTKLLLHKHGYSDRQEVDHTTGGDKVNSISPHQFISSKSSDETE